MRHIVHTLKGYLASFDALVLVLILIYSYIVWSPTVYLPAHWDGAGFVMRAVERFVVDGFIPWTADFSDFAQTPLFITYLAVISSWFAGSLTALHAGMFPFLPLYMVGTYYLLRRVTNSQLAGVVGAFIVGTLPTAVAQYGQLYLDLPVAALAVVALALWTNRYYRAGMGVLVLAFFTKVSAIVLLPVLLAWFWLEHRDEADVQRSLLGWAAVPIAIAAAWFGYHQLTTGWLFTRPGRALAGMQSTEAMLDSLWFVSQAVFFSYGFLLLALVVALVLILLWRKERSWKLLTPHEWILLGGVIFGILFFGIGGEYARRYGLFLHPLYVGFLVSILYRYLGDSQSISAQIWFSLLGVIVVLRMVWLWHPEQATQTTFLLRPHDDLTYQDLIFVQRSAAYFTEHILGDPQMYGHFPENLYLTLPYLGYVETPQRFDLCENFEYEPDVEQVIYLHPYSPGQSYCMQLLNQLRIEQAARYERNGVWVELYRVLGLPEEASGSAASNE